jgi:hypothetical protein
LALMAAKCEETCFCLDLAGWKLTLVVQKALCQQMSASCTMLCTVSSTALCLTCAAWRLLFDGLEVCALQSV